MRVKHLISRHIKEEKRLRDSHLGIGDSSGASDGRTYKGESRYGVSVFDFKIPRPAKTDEGRMSPSFIGYGRVPGM